MSCSHCAHCRALENPAALTLSGPPSSSPKDGADLSFYREYGLAYDRARQLRLRPRQALTAANPWLSDSQCTAYLKRARALGLVQAAPRRDRQPATPAPVPVEAPAVRRRLGGRLQSLTAEQCADILFAEDENTQLLLSNCSKGVPITTDKLRRAHSGRLAEREAADVLQWAVNSGLYQWTVPGESILATD